MSDISTSRLRELLNEATPGPWSVVHDGGTEDDYWERVRDIRKDEQILYDERYTPPEENPDNHHEGELMTLKTFRLVRAEDVSGVSGIGTVAMGQEHG